LQKICRPLMEGKSVKVADSRMFRAAEEMLQDTTTRRGVASTRWMSPPAISVGALRWFSSTIPDVPAVADIPEGDSKINQDDFKKLQQPFWTKPQMISTDDGRELVAFRTGYHPKLKPGLVARRVSKLRTYEGKEREIKYSKWKLNLICQFAAKLPLEEALKQLQFIKKGKAPLVRKVLKRTSNLADIRHGIQPSQLEVAECFSTRGTPIKDIKPMARGRSGRMEHPRSHMRVVLREIDFQLKIYQAKSTKDKHYWFTLQQKAEADARRVAAQKEEEERLEREDEKKKLDKMAENKN